MHSHKTSHIEMTPERRQSLLPSRRRWMSRYAGRVTRVTRTAYSPSLWLMAIGW